MKTNEIRTNQEVIDSRDIINRIEELENERTERIDELEAIDENERTPEEEKELQALVNYDFGKDEPEYITELNKLVKIREQAENCGDWEYGGYGSPLINDNYFQEYAQDLADDLGLIQKEMQWPHTCIDWEAASEALKSDYTEIDFDGVTFWVRS